jgi:hypothetical protein
MPTKTGLTRPRAGLGLTAHMPSSTIQKRPGKVDRNRTPSTSVKSAKPKLNRVGRRDTP